MFDVGDPRFRRRFYLDRAFRKRPVGSGSDAKFLMQLPRTMLSVKPRDLFADIPVLVAGGVATRAYAAERFTKDIDFLIEHERFSQAVDRLQSIGFEKLRELRFPNTGLGLYGEAWIKGSLDIDILSSAQAWCREAFVEHKFDQTGLRVIPLPYLVLMKFDSARGIDQGDLTRMLGTLDDDEVARIAAVVSAHSGDPSAADEIHQYAEIGRWEQTQQDLP